ncbi:MAG TPA: hypothetical protein VJ743_22115 [Albitalea sp.]|nr:hypothetical protein [Albitalea sp.]
MSMTLDSLARSCKNVLAADDTPAGRTRVASLLSEALKDPAFVREVFARPVGERKIAYEDADLGFCILAHEYDHARGEGEPHDHGPSWAIYGQAEGVSVMSVFELLGPGRVRKLHGEVMRPGDARVYNEGAIHAITHPGPARLVRIEGQDLAKVRRGKYEVAV